MNAMTTDLHALIIALAQARRAEASTREAYDVALKAWQDEHADLIQAQTEARQLTAKLDAAVREAAVAAYEATGDKRPHGAVTVRVLKRLHYDLPAAFQWVLDHEHWAYVTIDAREFERAAKANLVPEDVAHFEEVPSVAVNTKLDEYVPMGADSDKARFLDSIADDPDAANIYDDVFPDRPRKSASEY